MWGLSIFVFLILIVPDVHSDIELIGAAVTIYPTDNNTVAFEYRLSWINEMNLCRSDTPSSLPCPTGRNDTILFLEINCTDTETHGLNWTSGRGRLIYQPDEIQISYALSHGPIEANLEVRDGRINSSPTADMVPIVLLQDGCTHTLRIPVGDVDGDVIKCRWSTVKAPYDCGDLCDGLLVTEAEVHLNEEKCEITYHPNNSTGNYLAVLQIEDFSNTESNTSISSVPLQFFVRVYKDTDNHVDRNGNTCKHGPYFVDSTPADRACLEVEVDSDLVITITAKYTSRLDIVTIKPVGMLSTEENYTSVSETDEVVTSVNITWKPLMSDGGRFHIICFYASDPLRLRTSETRCIRIAVKGPNWSSNRLNGLFCETECQLPNAEVWNISYIDPSPAAYVFGDAVTYRCNAGYGFELSNQNTSSSTCMENGTFEDFQHCVRIECQLPNAEVWNVSYIERTKEAYFYGETVTYRCNTGYRFLHPNEGPTSVTCMENRSFQAFQQCVPIRCQLPNAEVLNISYTHPLQNTYDYGKAVTYRCITGYRFERSNQSTSSSTCMENESFEGFQSCVRIECQLPNAEVWNISYIDPSPAAYVFGEAVTYRCNAGYGFELPYQNTSSSTCMETGTFEDFQHCVRIECQLPNAEVWNISYIERTKEAYFYGETVTYRCNTGYRFLHPNQGPASVTCMENRSFQAFQQCVPIGCQLPNAEVLNISYTHPIRNTYDFGKAVTYRCITGYRFERSNQRTSSSKCMENESFEEFESCVRIECQLPNAEVWNISYIDPSPAAYVFGEAVTYRCNAGYGFERSNQDTSSSTCMENGTFENFQHCVRIECQVPNAEVWNISYIERTKEAYFYGETVTYRCNTGYRFQHPNQGPTSVTCMKNRSFRAFQQCVPIRCKLQNAEALNIVYTHPIRNTYGYGKAVTYRCITGYRFERSNQRTSSSKCMDNESFEEFESCVRIECELPDTSNLNINWIGVQAQKDFYYEETVAYACNTGYRFHDREKNKTIKCTNSGKFEKHTKCELTPKCQRDTDARGTTWNETLAENRANLTCPNDDQEITRLCDADGKWKAPLYKCVRKEIQNLDADIKDTLKHKNGTLKQANATEINDVVERLTVHTVIKGDTKHENETLTSGELVALSSSLETIANVLNNSDNNEAVKNENITKNFLLSCDNLIDSSNQNSWNAQTAEKKPGAETVLRAVDVLVEAIGKNIENDSTTIVQKNMALEIKRVDTEVKETVFPNEESLEESQENNWIKESRSSISLSSESLKDSNETYVTTAVMYKDLSEILPSSVVNDTSEKNGKSEPESSVEKKINGPILAMSIIPRVEILDPPVKITFQHFDKRLTKPDCSFWDFNRNEWSTKGCKVASRSKSNTVCECSHLTNFAVLMSPFKEVDASSVALEVISILGVVVSIICLLLTLIIHVLFWKLLSNDRTVILMNLCVALVVSNITFLAGINATENPITCAGVAAFLQYIYLVVFCVMLVEGITIAITVLYVFKTKRSLKKLIIPAWVVPVFVVGISLLSTEAEGYGTKSFCWLSIENGLIWTFVGPVLIILVCNVICLTLVFRAMFKTTAMEAKKAVDKVKTSFRCLCVLLPLMGLSWILGIFYVDERTVFIQYIFTILNAFQGFFIFLFHCLMSKQVKKALQLRFRRFSASHTALKSFSSTSGRHGSIKPGGKSQKGAGKSIEEGMSSMAPTESKSAPSESTQKGAGKSIEEGMPSMAPTESKSAPSESTQKGAGKSIEEGMSSMAPTESKSAPSESTQKGASKSIEEGMSSMAPTESKSAPSESTQKGAGKSIEEGMSSMAPTESKSAPSESTQKGASNSIEEGMSSMAPTESKSASSESTQKGAGKSIEEAMSSMAPTESKSAPSESTQKGASNSIEEGMSSMAPTESKSASSESTQKGAGKSIEEGMSSMAPTESKSVPSESTQKGAGKSIEESMSSMAPTESTSAPSESTQSTV